MKPQRAESKTISSGSKARTTFGVSRSLRRQAMLMRMMRDSIYTDKILAVLREYAANGWDAHRMIGIYDKPIRIQLPTSLNPVLRIRDYGPGMSHEDVFEQYTQYGESSKQGTDDEVGMFGVGCKSGFSYSRSFIVTSWFGGKKRVYTASLGKDDLGDFTLDYEGECGEETGMEIRIPVQPKDVPRFHLKARYLFRYFDPFPEIVYGDEGAREHDSLPAITPATSPYKHGMLEENGPYPWVAVMGCIPYRIQMSQFADELEARGLSRLVENHCGALFFPIGGIDFNAAREEVEYTERTARSLMNKLRLFRRELSNQMTSELETAATGLERRLIVRRMANMGIPAPKGLLHLGSEAARLHLPREGSPLPNPRKLVPAPTRFRFMEVRSKQVGIEAVKVSPNLEFYIRDTGKALPGFQLYGYYMVAPRSGVRFQETECEAVEAELRDLLRAAELDGAEIKRLSTLPWQETHTSFAGTPDTTKYTVSTFRLVDTTSNPLSNRWVIEDREPSDDDVYAIINRFQATRYDLYSRLQRAAIIAKDLGEKIPTIYGYKDTIKDPVRPEELKGIEFPEWEAGLLERLVGKYPKLKQMSLANRWSDAVTPHYRIRGEESFVDDIEKKLGPEHPVSFLFRRWAWGVATKKAIREELPFDRPTTSHIMWLMESSDRDGYRCPVKEHRKKLDRAYPLVPRTNGWGSVADTSHDHWFDYISLIDAKEHSNE